MPLIEDLGPLFDLSPGDSIPPFLIGDPNGFDGNIPGTPLAPSVYDPEQQQSMHLSPGGSLTGGVSQYDPRIQGAIRTALQGGVNSVDYTSVPGFQIQRIYGDPTRIPGAVTLLGGYPNLTGTIQMIPTSANLRPQTPNMGGGGGGGGFPLPPGYEFGYPPGGGGYGYPPQQQQQYPAQPAPELRSTVTINQPAPDTKNPAAATMLGALMQVPQFQPPNYPTYPSVNPSPLSAPAGYQSPGLMR